MVRDAVVGDVEVHGEVEGGEGGAEVADGIDGDGAVGADDFSEMFSNGVHVCGIAVAGPEFKFTQVGDFG